MCEGIFSLSTVKYCVNWNGMQGPFEGKIITLCCYLIPENAFLWVLHDLRFTWLIQNHSDPGYWKTSVKLSITLLKGEIQCSRLTWRHPVQYLKETRHSDLAAGLIMIASQLLLYWLYRYLRCFVLDHFKI